MSSTGSNRKTYRYRIMTGTCVETRKNRQDAYDLAEHVATPGTDPELLVSRQVWCADIGNWIRA